MSFFAKNYLIINFNNFKQLDHYFQSVYKLGIKVWSTKPSKDPSTIPQKTNLYSLQTKEFRTKIYDNTKINENFQLSFENECFPDFNTNLYIEVEFFVKGIKVKKFPQNSEGFSSIGKNLLRIKNVYATFHEYTELVFDDLICAIVSFGIHSSLVGYEFRPLKRQLSFEENSNKFLKNLLKSKNLEEYLGVLTKNAQVLHVDSFYGDYLKRIKLCAEDILIFLVQVFKTLKQEDKLNRGHRYFNQLTEMKHKIQNINLPYSIQFNNYVNNKGNKNLESKFYFRKTIIDNKNMVDSPRKMISTIDLDKSPKKSNFGNEDDYENNILKSKIYDKTKISNYLKIENCSKTGKIIFSDSKEVFKLIIKELEEFSSICKTLFISLKSLIDYSGEDINSELRMDYHSILKDRFLDNILTEKIEVENFETYLNKNYRESELLAEKFRKNEQHDEFIFESFKVDNLTIFDKTKIKPVFFEEIFTKKSYINSKIFEEKKKKKNHIERSNLFINLHKAQKPNLISMNKKSFINLKLENNKNTHLIVLVHGYQGSNFDLRLYKNYIAKLFPNSIFLLSNSNKEKKEASILQMGKNLAQEIIDYINTKSKMLNIAKISFIGHSLGGIVIRASLFHLRSFKNKMMTFISLSSPHLGCQINNSVLVGFGMTMLKIFKKSKVLSELDISDQKDYKKSVLFRLSKCRGFGWFKNHVFISCRQDTFVKFESARIQITSDVVGKGEKSRIYREMTKNIFESVKNDKIVRLSIDVRSNKKNFAWMLGQAPHLELLESHKIVKTILYHYGDYLC